MRLAENIKPVALFIATAALIVPVQWWAWNQVDIVDGGEWERAVVEASEWRFPAPDSFLHGYPASAFLIPAGQVFPYVPDARVALMATMIALTALAGALATVLAYFLRPHSLWWLFVAWTYAFQTQVSMVTIPIGLMVAFVPVFLLFLLIAAGRERSGMPLLLYIGMWGGVMLASRFDFGAVLLAAATLYLATRRLAALYVVPLSSLLVFALLNPSLMQEGPVEHIGNILSKIFMLAEASPFVTTHPFGAMSQYGEAGLLALGIGILLLASNTLRSFPKGFFTGYAVLSIGLLAALSLSHHHPSWMYAPVLVPLQVLLPLLILDAYKALPENAILRRLKPEGSVLRVLGAVYLLVLPLLFYTDMAVIFE